MNLREALRTQGPSYALQTAARDEIARLDALVAALRAALRESTWVDQHNPYPIEELRPELFR